MKVYGWAKFKYKVVSFCMYIYSHIKVLKQRLSQFHDILQLLTEFSGIQPGVNIIVPQWNNKVYTRLEPRELLVNHLHRESLGLIILLLLF